jgi:putative transposase
MRKSRSTEQQIALARQQADAGAPIAEVCRKYGIGEQTFYRWKKKFGQPAPSEIRKRKQLEDENRRLKGLVADLTLDKQMLQEVLRKKD